MNYRKRTKADVLFRALRKELSVSFYVQGGFLPTTSKQSQLATFFLREDYFQRFQQELSAQVMTTRLKAANFDEAKVRRLLRPLNQENI